MLRIYDWRFRDRRLEALYVEDPEPASVALSKERGELPVEDQESKI